MAKQFRITASASLDFEAAEKEGRKPRITIQAYNGGLMDVPGLGQVVVDLSAMQIPDKVTFLSDHKNLVANVVGQGEARVENGKLIASGVVSESTPAGAMILALARDGVELQASIAGPVLRATRIRPGQTITANMRSFTAAEPFQYVTKSELREITITPLGCDGTTSVSIAAKQEGEYPMTFEQWLEAKEFSADLTDPQKNVLRASYDAEIKAANDAAHADETPTKDIKAAVDMGPSIEDLRKEQAAEFRRIATIQASARDFPEIAAQAIEENWTKDQTDREVKRESELVELRASRPNLGGIAIHDGTQVNTRDILCAAVRMGSDEPQARIEKDFDDKVLSAADRFRGLGIKGLIEASCVMDGKPRPRPGASISDYFEAAFSTASLSGILGDSANKSMWGAYRAVPSVAKQIAKKLSANDFKTHTGYRMTGTALLEKVGENGELKYGTMDEESYSFSVATYGKMFGITRVMVKNDDLNAFLQIPQMIGRGAALAIESSFWTLVLANTGSFFAAGNSNYISGAATVLGSAGLGTAVQTLEKQTDADGHPINLMGKFLVIPPELRVTADELFVSTNLQSGNTGKQPDRNVFAGRYTPLSTPYLSNSSYTGYSATAWYLLPDPADQAAFGIAYLDGQENPTIEEKEQPANLLGKLWRGYIDYGVCQIDKRAGVMSKGAV